MDQFCKNRSQPDGLSNQCRECSKQSHRKNYYKDVAKTRAGRTASNRKRKYGITHEQFVAMKEAVGNRCPVCGSGPPDVDLVTDHCHRTGTVRGILCRWCNITAGNAQDNPARLEALAVYLRASVG